MSTMNAIKLYTQNYLDGNCQIVPTSVGATATKAYLYDQNQSTQMVSSISADATPEVIDINFRNWQGASVSRTIDTVIMLNHNIKGITIYTSPDGSTWTERYASTTIATTNTYISLGGSYSAEYVRVSLGATQTADQAKAIGELKFCAAIFSGTQEWRSSLSRSDEQKAGFNRSGEGRLVFWREWTRFTISGNLYDVTLANYQSLQPYLKTAVGVTVVMYEDFDPTECYECAIVSPPSHSINRKTGLFEISLELQEK